ncbi:hypothetical protein N9D77_03315 [Paracoccaceae bacterium]|nr:hypothetical protein [Paracoccaceae bacterium]
MDGLKIIFLFIYQIIENFNNTSKDMQYSNYRIVCLGVLNVASIMQNSPPKVTLHGYAYVIEIYLTSYILSSTSRIYVTYKEYSSFPDLDLGIVANEYISSNQFTFDYNAKHKTIFKAEKYTKGHLVVRKGEEYDNKNIGVYYTGFYARRNHNFIESEVLNHCIAAEQKLNEKIYAFACERPDYTITLFPHYKRNVEDYATALLFYAPLTKLKNVQLATPQKNLSSAIDNINLGIVMNSGIFWDRLSAGHKTIFINPVLINDFLSQTNLRRISFEGDTLTNDILEKHTKMDFGEFYEIISCD